MKYFIWILSYFIPREEGGEGGGEGEGGEGEGEGGEGEGGQQKPQGGSDPEGKPDWLADKFWNPDLKQPRTEVLGKSFNELEGKFREKTETLKDEIKADLLAAAPESYEVNLSDELKIPEGVELDLTAEDPLVKWFFGFAKTHGMSQEDVDGAINEYIGLEIAGMPDMAAEIEKLGDHGQDRMLRVHNWMESKLSDDQLKSLTPLLSSAGQVEALEKLMKSSGPSDFDSDAGGEALTLAELREMQADPRAHQLKDPIWLKKIEDGYKRLYAGQK